jgi:hypothetical protein
VEEGEEEGGIPSSRCTWWVLRPALPYLPPTVRAMLFNMGLLTTRNYLNWKQLNIIKIKCAFLKDAGHISATQQPHMLISQRSGQFHHHRKLYWVVFISS